MGRLFNERLNVMEIVTSLQNYNPVPCAATIGSFDGVHLGHSAMLGELRSRAAVQGLPVMVITFRRHPRLLFNSDSAPFLLCEGSAKETMLSLTGVDILVQLDFDAAMASLSASGFMKEILSTALGVKMLAVGYDHHFGKPCEGEGLENYQAYGREVGMEVFGTSPFVLDGVNVSSSVVRRLLEQGDVISAAKFLGRNYSLCGIVVHCAGIGRTIGFPTANIELGEPMQMLPLNGVYEVAVTALGETYKGVMNIGVKPTVSDAGIRTIEVFIIGFSGDIYGQRVCVELVRRLRDERTFSSLSALRLQIETDVARVKLGI